MNTRASAAQRKAGSAPAGPSSVATGLARKRASWFSVRWKATAGSASRSQSTNFPLVSSASPSAEQKRCTPHAAHDFCMTLQPGAKHRAIRI